MMPFAGGFEGTENATLLFSGMAALFYAAMLPLPTNPRRSAAKTLAVGLLTALAVVTGGPLMLIVALGLSTVGDFFLSRDGETMFLAGLASFLVAHLAYIALFAGMGGGFGLFTEHIWRGAAALLLISFGVVMLSLLRPRVGPKLVLPVTAYVAAILGMGLSALTVEVPLVIAGALLFVLSDTLLATERFLLSEASTHRGWMRLAVWGCYFVAQFWITIGLLT